MQRQIKQRRMPSQNETSLLRLRLAMAEYQQRVGARIKAERQKRGWSQNELASRIPGKTDGAAVGRWERGGVFPRANTLDSIAQALEVDPSVLLSGEPEPPSGSGDVLDALKPPASDLAHLATRIEDVATAVERLLEAQQVLAQMAEEDRELLREVAQAVRPAKRAR